MKQEFNLIKLTVLISIFLCGLTSLQTFAMESSTRPALAPQQIDNARRATDQAPRDARVAQARPVRNQTDRAVDTLRNPNQQGPRQEQLRGIDQEIARLQQILREAQQIRTRIAQQTQQQTQQPATRPVPPSTGARRGGQGQRQNLSVTARTGARRLVNNLPQVVTQLRTAFNNNVERVQNAYQAVQQRLTDLQTENQRLRTENQQLRKQNQDLRNRLQQAEPRRPASDAVQRPPQ